MATAVAIRAPQGVKLDRSRVNGELSRLSDARVGETVDFFYDGGSEPGVRTVLVCKVNPHHGIEGLDKVRDGEWRAFLDSRAENIDVVEPFADETPTNEVRVRFDTAAERLANSLLGEQLAQLYLKFVATEGETAHYDAVTGEVVVVLPAPTNKVSTVHNSEVTFTNRQKERLTQYLYTGSNKIGIDIFDAVGNNTYSNDDVAPEDLAAKLAEFFAR